MELVLAQCTQCGATLEVDSSKETALCPSCKSAFVVEKAIHNYNYNVANNISDSVVNIYGGQTRDFIIRGGILEKYVGESTTPIIPNTVVEIGQQAFMNTRITSVKIPDSVKVIEFRAFSGCTSLEAVDIPDSVKEIWSLFAGSLRSDAFYQCTSLKTVHLPVNLEKIEVGMFMHCSSLESINIPNSVKRIERDAFNNCISLKELRLPATLEQIGEEAFFNCSSLSEIEIPSVESIGPKAFEGCGKLTKLVLPSNLRTVLYAFGGCSNITEFVILGDREKINNSNYKPELWYVLAGAGAQNLKVTLPNTKSKPFYLNRPPKEGCYIATAVYGSYDCPQLWTLRRFRDQKLLKSMPGRTSIKIYYTVSPTLVKIFGSNKCFTGFWKRFLDLFVEYLNQKGIKRDTYND